MDSPGTERAPFALLGEWAVKIRDLVIVLSAVPLLACCSNNSLGDTEAQQLIANYFTNYSCADWYTVGPVTVGDKMMNAPPALAAFSGAPTTQGSTNEAIVEATTVLTKTSEFSKTHTDDRCTYDWNLAGGRFSSLSYIFAKSADGTPVNIKERYRFQRWQSGWRIVDVE